MSPAVQAPVRVELVGHVPMAYRICPRGLGLAQACGLGGEDLGVGGEGREGGAVGSVAPGGSGARGGAAGGLPGGGPGAGGLGGSGDWLAEYPEAMRRRGEVLAEWHWRLLDEFGPRVLPVRVPLTTPRGFWLALRHGLRTDEVAAVVSGRAVRDREGYEAVRRAVQAALGRAALKG